MRSLICIRLVICFSVMYGRETGEGGRGQISCCFEACLQNSDLRPRLGDQELLV